MTRAPRDRPGVHHSAAVLPGAGAELEHEIGLLDRRQIVLDDDDGIARVAKPVKQPEQPVDVPRMQPDRRLVQHVQRVHQVRAERVGQGDALGLAAGESAGLTVERQIAQPDIAKIAHPGVELIDNQLRHRAFPGSERELLQPLVYGVHRAVRHRPDGVIPDSHGKGVRVEAGPAALGAGLGQLILPQEDPDVLLVPLLLQSFQKGIDADETPLASVEQLPALGRLQLGPGLVGVGADGLARTRAESCGESRSAAWSRGRSPPPPGSCRDRR